jgi:hypothetical protein
MKKHLSILVLFAAVAVITACQKKNQSEQNSVEEKLTEGTFGYDLAFLNKYKKPLSSMRRTIAALRRYWLPTIRVAL